MADTPAPATFDPPVLRARLRTLRATEPARLTPQETAYLHHYRIHFSEEFPGTIHHFGLVESERHRLATHAWVPAQARGTAVVVHGYYDHVGLYGHLIRHLIAKKFAVLAFDLPGHGLSSGEPASINSFDDYVAALDACVAALQDHLPGPAVLFGQSTGGAIAMEWLLANGYTRDSNPFARVVLLAPLVRPHRWPAGRVFYEVARPFIKQRRRTFSNNSDNAEFVAFLRDRDPLQARVLPVRWVTAMIDWRRRFERYPPTDIAPLVIQGRADTTVDWRYNMKVIARLFEPRVVFIPAARHHLVNESAAIRAQIFQAIDGELSGISPAR